MAAHLRARTEPNTPTLAGLNSEHVFTLPRLPTGGCNYTNLSVGGATPPRCGCQRFWARSEKAGRAKDQDDEEGWCHCSHHACYHLFVAPGNHGELLSGSLSRSEPLESNEQRGGPYFPSENQERFRETIDSRASIADDDTRQGATSHAKDLVPLSDSALPSTNGWDSVSVLSEPNLAVLPPIPSGCLLPSGISSGNVSLSSRSFETSLQPVLDILKGHSPIQQEGLISNESQDHLSKSSLNIPLDQHLVSESRKGSPDSNSATNTLNIHASADLNRDPGADQSQQALVTTFSPNVVSDRPDIVTSSPGTYHVSDKDPILQIAKIPDHLKPKFAHRTFVEQLHNHEIRLDNLENMDTNSFMEETHDQYQAMRCDIDDLEASVKQIETQLAAGDMSSLDGSRRIDDGNGSMISTTSSAMVASALHRADLSQRLGVIENEFRRLRSEARPTQADPWKAEVVFLPFGPELRGIWSANTISSDRRSSNNSDVVSGRKISRGADPESGEYLMPRACQRGSKVEERLRSRGLVKEIEVNGPEARDVQAAMNLAFGEITKILSDERDTQYQSSLDLHHIMGTPWVPLRKVHKDSTLRLLDPAELVTPALWTVMFLSSTVAMRFAGKKRLYVTEPESYLQSGDSARRWTWQKLRMLPRVAPDLDATRPEVGEADALEACWAYDYRFDEPPSVHSSFDSHQSSLSIRAASRTRSNVSLTGYQPPVTASTASLPFSNFIPLSRAVSPLAERSVRPPHSRTTSMPVLKTSQPSSKRRIASYEQERQNSQYIALQSSPVRPTTAIVPLKRARISRSPSRPRDTPRWSVGPPSPYYFEDEPEPNRGTTPFAYATPHSNTTYMDFKPHSVVGFAADDEDMGSTTDDAYARDESDDVDSDAYYKERHDDDIWEGMDEHAGEDGNLNESDQEDKALSDDEDQFDNVSESSSQPSEYSSKQPLALGLGSKRPFHIHVDEDIDQFAAE